MRSCKSTATSRHSARDLARIAAVGDESTARAAPLLAVALESSLSRRLLEALGEAALELNRPAGGRPGRGPLRRLRPEASLSSAKDVDHPRRRPDEALDRPHHPPASPTRLKVASSRTTAAREGRVDQHVDRAGARTHLVPAHLVSSNPAAEASPATAEELKGVTSVHGRPTAPRKQHWVYDDPSGVAAAPTAAAGTRTCPCAPRASSSARAAST